MKIRTVYKMLAMGLMVSMFIISASAAKKSTGSTVKAEKNVQAINQSKPLTSILKIKVLNEIQHLINLSQKESSIIRREINKIKTRKSERNKNSDLQPFIDLANQYNDFSIFMKKNKQKLNKSTSAFTKNDLQFFKTMARDMEKDIHNNDSSHIGNFDIQELMSRATQARNLAASIKKHMDKANETLINNIGDGGGGSDDDPDD